jgi:hypothetical protein
MLLHLIVRDNAGSGYPRLSCTTCGTAVVRAPYMSDVEWEHTFDRFLAEHPTPDPTEGTRRVLMVALTGDAGDRAALEAKYGQVWTTDEMQTDFDVISFLAPFVHVVRKADKAEGSLMFQPRPRFYFSFEPK